MSSKRCCNEISIDIIDYKIEEKKEVRNNILNKRTMACCISFFANVAVISNPNICIGNTQNVNYLSSALYNTSVYTYINKDNISIDKKRKVNSYNDTVRSETGSKTTSIENITVTSEYNGKVRVNKVEMEEEKMIKEILEEMRMSQMKFLKTAASLIIFSLIGFCSFVFFDFVLINPAIYIFLLIMGLGWGSTAVASIIKGRC